jgi:hypothetical protein
MPSRVKAGNRGTTWIGLQAVMVKFIDDYALRCAPEALAEGSVIINARDCGSSSSPESLAGAR